MPIHLSLPKRYTVLYYECLNYNKKTLADIEEDFNVVYLPDPRHDTKLTERDRSNIVAIFHPISYLFGDGQSVLLRNLRYIVSNTTSTPNITIDNNTGVEIISLEGSPILTNITATAEHTLALIMAVHSRIIPVQSDLSEWNRFNWGRKKIYLEM
jgi:lactate dehydrogenase-like 2-hydroxyacid dehydrogenase